VEPHDRAGRVRMLLILSSSALFLIALVHYTYHATSFTEQLVRIAAGAVR
jgi:hypothetical protein